MNAIAMCEKALASDRRWCELCTSEALKHGQTEALKHGQTEPLKHGQSRRDFV